MNPLWSRLLAVLDAAPSAALVTVVAAEGSTPREAGARMIVRPDGGFLGTIGGGALEWELIAEARGMLAAPGPARLRVRPLGPELGQCCGGRVTTLIEVFGPDDRAHVADLAAEEARGLTTEAVLPPTGRRLARAVLSPPHPPHGEEPAAGGRLEPSSPRSKTSWFETAPPGPPHHEVFAEFSAVIPGGAADPGPSERSSASSSEGVDPGSPLRSGRDDARERESVLLTDRLVETFRDARTPLALFGAGHVGRALVLALAPLPFRIRWIDPRADAFPALVPENATPVPAADPAAEIAAVPPGGFVLVMTHSHPLDLDVTVAALRREDLAFVGLIGSATKRARFEKRMRDLGLTAAALRRLVCPIGVAGVAGKEPAVIAAGVAAQLLVERGRSEEGRART